MNLFLENRPLVHDFHALTWLCQSDKAIRAITGNIKESSTSYPKSLSLRKKRSYSEFLCSE